MRRVIWLGCCSILVNDVRQMEIHTAQPLVHEPSAFEDEMASQAKNTQITRCGSNAT
jgi:hypothetical protein